MPLKKIDLNKLIIFLDIFKKQNKSILRVEYKSSQSIKTFDLWNGTILEDFLKNLQKEFKIQRKIKLTDSNAEITSIKYFYNGRKLLIEIIQEDEQDIEVDKSDQNDEEDKNSFVIQLDGIAYIKYSSDGR